jgi:DNA-binding transcriptional MerR regulator
MKMNLITISEISKGLCISTRTLRYYEQIGLIESVKKDDYAYRTYDEATVTRLQQILVLRKLRIPLKQIGVILQSENTIEIIEAFQQNLNEVDDEITALSTIREIIGSFIARLNETIHQDIKLNLLDDTALLEAVDALTVRKASLKEEKTAEVLQAANEKLNKLTDRDVRIIYLPPATVAVAYAIGEEPGPELVTDDIIRKFIQDTKLEIVYPAARHFGFNNPDEPVHGEGHGYERWITIPDDMEVPAPLVKKHLDGGLYAAHMIPMGAWDEWIWLHDWVSNSDRYDFRWGTIGDGLCGWLEEHLNYWSWHTPGVPMEENDKSKQLDLLIPVKPKFAARTQHPQERIIDTFNYNGVPVEVVEWSDTIWCGKVGYAENNTDEPNVDVILNGFMSLDTSAANKRSEPDWDVCMSINYFSSERPNGVMFGFLVGTEHQPDGFDIYKLPAGQYLRIAINDETANAVGAPPWQGGIPPYEWIGEQLAPQFGYQYGDDRLPVFEYYGFYKPDKNAHEFRYLYVPVEKTAK